LLVKAALLAVLGGLGLVNSALLHGRIPARLKQSSPSRSRRLIVVEAAVGAALLVAGGFLADTAPPRVTGGGSAVAQSAASSVTVDDLVVTVSVAPGRPGPNVFSVIVASSRRPPPAPVDNVAIAFNGTGMFLGRTGPEQYLGAAELDRSGHTDITVAVFRAGKRLNVSVPVQVSSAVSTATARASRLAPYANATAVCLLVLASGVGVVVLNRRRRRRPLVEAPPQVAEPILEEVR
jgi:hypothetical protein